MINNKTFNINVQKEQVHRNQGDTDTNRKELKCSILSFKSPEKKKTEAHVGNTLH